MKTEITKKRRRVRKEIRRACWAILWLIVVGVMIFTITHLEYFSSIAAHDLMISIEQGDEGALEYYKSRYTDHGVYLFDGNVSLGLMADKLNVTSEFLGNLYRASEAKNLQAFYCDYVKGSEETIALMAHSVGQVRYN